ncbi:MAG: hypothetical protein A3A08_00650 [Candidatus Nealsonbacteria bacterium RIFCSPLOWO2_01_FULL_41_9]|uniref:Uncharacterized protein n=1 Tax=Candidatus Nealsonbacteria bacterium RIFCSPLOWO2_01_FULL_41_9 TaxID=1801671 RepID=A0A1G2EBU0_9BACT|nr:MAG: hypothetical protein A3A08_00650 [Candidatus Nealsonbacteria bacterium RIFCSPLOWO2_01_FULL_41_9]
MLLTNNSLKFFWTNHSKMKMRQYRLSEQRVLRVLRRPDRKEEGIAPDTLASMQITGTKKNPTEIWLMYVFLKRPKGIKIISTWRYPARSPIGRPPVPQDILDQLDAILKEEVVV